jgi:hypothetical protein
MIRLTLAAAAVLVAATTASAQAPGFRGVPTVSPVPAIVIQQQQAWQAAQQQAYLYRMSQPPVFVVNPFPVEPVYDPFAFSPSATTFRWTGVTPTGTLFQATKTYYRPAPAFNPYSPFRW